MATKKPSNKPEDLKPGSNPADAARIGGKGDFGVPESDVVGRTYTSRNTKASDPGSAQARSGEDGARVSGAGAAAGGVGSGSGGDVDTDIIGFGTGGGIAQSGSTGQHTPGPDDSDGSSNEFASGKPAEGRNQDKPIGRVKGTVHQMPDDRSVEGSADATSRADGSDAFAGEITSGEASGGDNSPSDRQG